ncbi:MAG: beta strand repeat-containing protein, partial [Verrucomicrobiota bacterium]
IASTSASGGLTPVLWSDFANTNVGGVWLATPVSTGGGHLWIGGSSTANGSTTWNGLTVGDGPSIGANGSNWNAIDFYSVVNTGGGDMYLWVGDGYSSGLRAYFANTSSVSTGSGSFTLRSDSVSPQSGFTLPVATSGTFTWEPNSASFAAAVSPFSGLFSFTGSTVGSVVIGKAGNTADVTIAATPAIAGSLTVYGGNLTVSGNVTTSVANAAVVLKAASSVTQNASVTVQTNGGDIVYWADSGGVGSGNRGILISDSSVLDSRTAADRAATTHTTGGGTIVLGGGSTTATSAKGTTIPTGYALNYTGTPAGLMIGSYNAAVGHNANVRMYSGGGDVVWRGKSTQNVVNLTIGISAFEGVTVNAGTTGDITIDGVAVGNTTAAGMDIHGWRTGVASSSYLTVDGDILFTSSGTGATTNVGTQLGSSAGFPIILAATGSGSVTVKGVTSGTFSDITITDVQFLSGSGSVSVLVDRAAGKLTIGGTNATAKLGQAAGSVVTSSSAAVLLSADVFDVNSTNGLAINTTGSVELTSFNATGFTAAASFSRLDVGRAVSSAANSISSFTLGKTTNTQAVTVTAGGVNALGPVRVYGSNLTIGAPLRTDAASAEILLQGTGFVQTSVNLTTTGSASPIRLLAGSYVHATAASTWRTSGSDVLVAANTDGTGGGYIYGTGDQSIITSGGAVTLAGGNATGLGYAEGMTTATVEGIRYWAALSIDTSVKTGGVSTGGGDIILRGRSFTSSTNGYGAWGVGVDTTTTFDSGTGTIRLDGISQSASGDAYNMGVRLLGNASMTSASTSATAIHLSGTGGSAASSYSGGQGLRLTGTANLLTATGAGGGIKLSGTPGSEVWAVVFEGGSILAASGPI